MSINRQQVDWDLREPDLIPGSAPDLLCNLEQIASPPSASLSCVYLDYELIVTGTAFCYAFEAQHLVWVSRCSCNKKFAWSKDLRSYFCVSGQTKEVQGI